jgi:pimeloyl-ACP methyl ester carboxylesterase
VSYGGLIALRYAATRPDRVGAVVFVSAPAPGWKPSSRQSAQIASPWLSTPGFVLGAPFRVWPEIRAALPGWRERLRFAVVHGLRVLAAPSIPSMMARRVRQQEAIDFERDLDRITAPVLVVTGEEALDTVVPVHVTQRYCDRIPGARYVRMDGTGHIGMITQPDRFATVVAEFVHAHHQ